MPRGYSARELPWVVFALHLFRRWFFSRRALGFWLVILFLWIYPLASSIASDLTGKPLWMPADPIRAEITRRGLAGHDAGFLTFLYALVRLGAFAVLILPLFLAIRRDRRRFRATTACIRCGYQISERPPPPGLDPVVCPECGYRLSCDEYLDTVRPRNRRSPAGL